MSSMRNAVQRRNHKERSQPHGREKWGILEKRKDYSLRARDFNEKKKRLKILRQKAADRNPDEFAFAMMSTKTVNGQKIGDRGNEALSMDVVKGLKTQDAGYLRTMLQRTRKEIEKLEQEIRLTGDEEGGEVEALRGSGMAKHMVFVDDVQEQKAFDAAQWFGTDGEGLDIRFNRPRMQIQGEDDEDVELPDSRHGRKSRKALLAEEEAVREAKRARKRRRTKQEGRLKRLEELRESERELAKTELELELQRARMSNSVGGVNKNGVKFKIRQRKR